MKDLKIQGMILLLIGCVLIVLGWSVVIISIELIDKIVGSMIFSGGTMTFVFGYIFIKFSILEGR